MIAPLAWTTYLLIPVAGWGLFEGCPLDPLGAAALCAVWWIWGTRETLGWGRLLVALTVVKLLLGGPLLVEHGFLARYFANPSWTAPLERSLEFPRSSATRIDRRLRFGAAGFRDLPLFFTNELRFNFYNPDQPDRERLPFSVDWSGYIDTRRVADPTFYMAGEGLTSEFLIDGRLLVTLRPGQRREVGSTTLQPGWHRIAIRLSALQGAGRRFEAGRIDPSSGRDRPLDASGVFHGPVSRSRVTLDRLVRSVSFFADAMLLAALALWVAATLSRDVRDTASSSLQLFGRGVTAAIWLAACFDAFLFALPASGRLVLLGGGGDPLTYESYARDIVLHGPLMLLGAARGHAAPFYYQPLYPYALAIFHHVFGEGFFGIYFIQRLLIAATAFSVARTASLLFGRSAGRVVFFSSVLFLYLKAGTWAGVLLGESLFIPLVAVWVQLLVTAAVNGPSLGSVALAGFVGGLATLSRSTLILAWVVALPVWGFDLRQRRSHPARWLSFLLVVLIGVTSLAALRNWIAADRFVPLSTSFSVNLFLGNEPPKSVNVSSTSLTPAYEAFHVDQYTRSVIEYARQAPRHFARHIGQKAVYTLGLFRLSGLTPSVTGSAPYVVVWVLALVGLAIAWHRGAGSAPLLTLLLPGLVSGVHLFSVVAIFPNIYGDRLILPLYVLLLPYAGYALTTRQPAPLQLGDEWVRLLFVAALLGSAIFLADGEALVFGLGAIVLVAAFTNQKIPNLRLRHLPYVAYLAVLTTSALLYSSTEASAEYWRQILFLVIAFSSARLFRSNFAQNTVVALLLATAGAWLVTHIGWASGFFGPLVPGGGAAASQLWRWHVVGDAIGAGSLLFGSGLGALFALKDTGVGVGSAGGFIAVVAELGIVGLLCYLVLWIRVLAISFGGALAGQPREAAIHGILLASFAFNQRLSAATPQANLAFLVFLGIAFGVAEASQVPPTTPIGTAGPRSSPMATPT